MIKMFSPSCDLKWCSNQGHIILERDGAAETRKTVCIIISGKSWELAVSQHKFQGDALASELFTTLQRVLLVPSVHSALLCA